MIRQLNVVAAALLKERLESLGLHIALETQCESITQGENGKLHCQLNNERHIDADVIIVATGIRSRDGLARDAKIPCSPSGGVVIDDHLSGDDPSIFAIGECARHRGTVYGLAAPGYRMATALANHLSGSPDNSFTGSDMSTKLKLAGIDVWTLGDYQANGDTVSYRGSTSKNTSENTDANKHQTYRQLVTRNGELVGATLIGPCEELARIQDAVARQLRFSVKQLRTFEKNGELFASENDNPALWPEQAIVCTCMQINRGTIAKACAEGCSKLDDIAQQTKAGSVCGSCRPLISQIIGAPIEPEILINSGNRSLKIVSIVAVLTALAVLFVDLPYQTSIVNQMRFDLLWTEGFWRQFTGWTLVWPRPAHHSLNLAQAL